jgi:hypothetical protein
LVINANLIMGNQAESGSGGGLALQQTNGSDVVSFPTTPANWNNVTLTNNIITNNVAGWDGAGISLLDALNVNIINNTIMSNDSTASAGILFNTIGAPLASTQGSNCTNTTATASCPQPGGLVSIQNSAILMANLPATITCPIGHGPGGSGGGGLTNGACREVSYPVLYNDVFWDNRSYYIGVGALGTGTTNQQNVVTLYNAFTTTAAPSQATTGACPTASYWDIGVRGDTGPTNHASTFTLTPEASILTNITGYPGGGTGFRVNSASNPAVVSQYCNGSRVPPEFGGPGWQVPPGIADATVPNPIFNLTPTATVDEGNNWINISWGPLAMANPVTGTVLGNYSLTGTSPAINYITSTNSATTYGAAPTTDFFGNGRKGNLGSDTSVDIGAVEFQATGTTAIASVTGGPLSFGNVPVGTTSAAQTLTLHNTGTANVTGITVVVTAPFSRPTGAAGGTCGATLTPAPGTCTINVVFSPTAAVASTGSVTITANVTVSGSPVSLSGTGIAAVRTVTVSPTSLTFANRVAGTTSAAQTITITNTGNVTLTGGTATFGGGTPQPFARAAGAAGGTCTATIAAGASCTYNVVFSPTVAGSFSRTLTFAATGWTVTGSPVALTGTSSAVAVAFSAPTPSLVTGTTTPHSGTVTVTNNSGAVITLASAPTVAKVGFAGGTFTIGAGGTCTNGSTVAAGATCTIVVTYNPGGTTTTATAHVVLTDTLAGAAGTATQTGPNFTAN